MGPRIQLFAKLGVRYVTGGTGLCDSHGFLQYAHGAKSRVYMNNGSVSGVSQVPRRGLFLFLRRMFPTVYLSRVCIGKTSLLATR